MLTIMNIFNRNYNFFSISLDMGVKTITVLMLTVVVKSRKPYTVVVMKPSPPPCGVMMSGAPGAAPGL